MRFLNRFFLIFTWILAACGGAPGSGGLSAAGAPNAVAVAENTPSSFSARLSEIAGTVLARQAAEPQFLPAQDGYQLELLGQVQTEAQALVRLDFPNGTLVRLGPNTLFTLQAPEEQSTGVLMRVRLELGRLWVILNGGSLEVETKSGVAAVRGSYLSVGYDPETGQVKISCLEGHCSLKTSAGSVDITAGQTAVATGVDQPPQTGEMDTQDFQDWLNNNPEAALLVPDLTLTPEVAPTATEMLPTPLVPTLAPPMGGVRPQPSATPKDKDPLPPTEAPTATAFPTATSLPTSSVTVTITSVTPLTSVVVGEPVTVTVLVQPAVAGPVPTGTVKILNGTYVVCSGSLDSAGAMTCSGGIATAGTISLKASYSGDPNYIGAFSSAASKTVNPGTTTVTIQSQSPNPSLVNTPVTFTATVDHLYAPIGSPTGSVVFTSVDGYTCTATSAPWTCTMTFTTDGSRFVSATYSGDANFGGSSTSGNVAQDVWATADTLFSPINLIGPSGTLYSGQCSQTYQVSVVDLNGFNQVFVQYSLNDALFTAPQTLLLTHVTGDLWARTEIIPATYPSRVY